MDVKFGKDEEKAPVEVESTTVANTDEGQETTKETHDPVAELEVPARVSSGSLAPSGLVMGDKLPTFGEIILPRINLVHNVGRLCQTFRPGEIVFGQSTVIYTPPVLKDGEVKEKGTDPCTMVVLGFRPTRFVEKVDGGGRGMLVNSPEEVSAAGGTLDYKEWQLKKPSGMKYFQYLADAVVLVERPKQIENDGTVFIYDVEGKQYALALWSMKGTAYTKAAKTVFFTQRSIGYLRQGGYPSYKFSVSTKLSHDYTNPTWIPVCVPQGKTSPALLEVVAGILSSE